MLTIVSFGVICNYSKGKFNKIIWFNNFFQEVSNDVGYVVKTQHTREHILMLIGSSLMLDTSIKRLHFMYILLLINLNKRVKL